MHPQLATIVDDFERMQARLHALVQRTSETAFARRPPDGGWSAAECVAHLNLTSRAFVPLLRDALAAPAARSSTTPSRLRRDPAGWLVSVFAGPLPTFAGRRLGRVKAPASFVPASDRPRHTLVSEFDQLQATLIDLTRAADGAPVDRLRIVSPFDARMRYSVYSALYTLPRHEQRHLEQAEAAVRAEATG